MSGSFIGLGGKLRAGKDAVADHLVDSHGFVKVGMSDVLHLALLAIDPYVPLDVIDVPGKPNVARGVFVLYSEMIEAVGYVEAKENPKVRLMLQKLGTEVGRKMLGEDVWVERTGRNIAALLASGSDVALTGVRYPNELTMVDDLGGLTIWVHRPGIAAEQASIGGHDSENSVKAEDFGEVVLNDGTLKQLHASTDNLPAKAAALNPTAPEFETIPAQQVLVDGAFYFTLAQLQPDDPTKVMVESYATGPLVIDRNRISLIA